MAPDSVDLPELRRADLRKRAAQQAKHGNYWAGKVGGLLNELAVVEAHAKQALDRIDALEAREVELLNELDDERVAYAELLTQRDGLDAGYAEAGRLLRRIIRDQCGSDFVDPEVGGSFAVCADMDAVELAAWLGAELNEPGSADPGAVAGEPESEETGLLPCPSGCGCVTAEDPDARECGCDGPCCFGENWPIRAGEQTPEGPQQ